MALIALVAILYFLIGAFVCLLICVNPNKPGPLGASRRFIFNTLPDKVRYMLINPATLFGNFSGSECLDGSKVPKFTSWRQTIQLSNGFTT